MFAIAPLSMLAFAASSADAHPRTHDDARLSGSGTLVTEAREVPEFRAVSSEVPLPVEIAVGAAQSVTITCDDNLLPRLVTTVRDGTLSFEVDGDRDVGPSAGCVARVSLPALDAVSLAGSGRMAVTGETALSEVSLAGSGDIEIGALASRHFEVSVAGSGAVIAKGAAGEVEVSVAGSGNVRLQGLAAEEASVSIVGSGDVALTVLRTLEVSITGSGDVHVSGEPSIEQSVVGSGRVVQAAASM